MTTSYWNIYRLATDVLKDSETCIEWLMEQELLPRSRNCPKCKKEMKLEIGIHGWGRFRCRKKHSSGGPVERQLTQNTLFEGAKITSMKAVLLIYAFATKMSFDQAIRETSLEGEQTSSETVTDWYSYCRETCMDTLDCKYDEGEIGGEGHIVEIDECKIGRRKYNKGRMIDGHWILGMIDREGGFRLEICPNNKRDRATLEELIKKHVAPGTTIMTDCWRGYDGLNQQGFEHFTVNHKYHFVNPETGANTQMIESNWRPLRKRLSRGGVKDEQLAMHMCEFLWRKDMVDQKMDAFIGMLQNIKRQFPVM